MKIDYINQDITKLRGTPSEPVRLLHGCNAQGRMNSGAARAISDKWPVVKSQYLKIPKQYLELGKIQRVEVEEHTEVINCITQKYYGRDGKKYASVHAIVQCIKAAHEEGIKLYMVKIGSDLGGLDWDLEVVPAIEKLNLSGTMTVCVFNGPR